MRQGSGMQRSDPNDLSPESELYLSRPRIPTVTFHHLMFESQEKSLPFLCGASDTLFQVRKAPPPFDLIADSL